MQNIFSAFEFINFCTDKYRNGTLSPEEVSQALDAGQLALFNFYLPGKIAGDDIGYSALIPFKTEAALTSNSSGLLSYPSDWVYTEAIYEGDASLNTVLHDELQEALRSVLYPIAENPRYIEGKAGIQLYPAQSHSVVLHYLKKPDTPVIGYSVVGNQIVYDPVTSVQLEFAPSYWMQIIENALPFVGVNLNQQDVQGLFNLFQQTQR